MVSEKARGSGCVLEHRQFTETVPGCSGEHDLAPLVFHLEAGVRHRHEVPAKAENAADLEHHERHLVLVDDEIVDGADVLRWSFTTVLPVSLLTR